MPNWCENDISITGPSESLRRLFDNAKSDDGRNLFSFKKLYPIEYPEDWSYWCANYWGTKWEAEHFIDPDELDCMIDEGYVSFFADTPWSPPISFFWKISKDYPDLRFKIYFEESGEGFSGVALIKDGFKTEESIQFAYIDDDYDSNGEPWKSDDDYLIAKKNKEDSINKAVDLATLRLNSGEGLLYDNFHQ